MNIWGKNLWQDFDYDLLDPGIRDLVRSLHVLGITTDFSCEGHIRKKPWHIGVYPWPWIVVILESEQMTSLQQKIDAWNSMNPQKKWILSVDRIHGSYTLQGIRDMLALHHPGCKMRALVPEDENPHLNHNVLLETQAQVIELASFFQRSS